MLLLRTFAPWLLFAFLGQEVSVFCSAGGEIRGADEAATSVRGRGQPAGDKPVATGRGKFSIKDKMRCTWGATDVGDTVRLSVRCDANKLTCQYVAKPRSCAGYLSDSRGFWKQVARALNRLQGKVCTDERALVKAGMCKRAPREAHFRLDAVGSVTSAEGEDRETPEPTACTGRADHRTAAEDYCSSSWASVCSFLFSMLQRDC